MAVASHRRPKATVWCGGAQVHLAAERDGLAWSRLGAEQEKAGFALEAIVAPATVDDGLDRYDPADDFCLSFASPMPGERDPNAQIHDPYAGTVYER